MQHQKNKSLLNLAGILIAAGVGIYLLQFVAHLLIPIAGLCVVVGIVLAIVGLAMPRKL